MDGSTLSYEQLSGETGKKVFFRPRRFASQEVFRSPAPQVTLNGQPWNLENLSLSGLALCVTQGDAADLRVGDEMKLRIEVAEEALFEGIAVIRRIDAQRRQPMIGVSLQGTTIDIEGIRRGAEAARARLRLRKMPCPANTSVIDSYRLLCTDVLHMLASYRKFLETAPAEHDEELVASCLERMMPVWRQFWRQASDMTKAVLDNPRELRAMKELTELVLTPEFCKGAIWNRSYTKPLGYPGDFQVMNYVYDWQMVGETPYEKLLHALGLDAIECVRTRMTLLEEVIEKEAGLKPKGTAIRALSLGSGPAREVGAILGRTGRDGPAYEFTLIDQEPEALQYAYEGCFPVIATSAPQCSINCLNLSMLDVLRGNVEDERVSGQDIVYSLGLFDYLHDRRSRQLAASMFSLLRPGGLMVIGNVNDAEFSGIWPTECLLDWRMFYRTDADMRGWAEGLDAAECWTETEPTGHVRLLFVRKRG